MKTLVMRLLWSECLYYPHPDLTVEILTPKLMCWEVGALKGDQVET